MIDYEQILTDLISWVREKMAEIGGTKAVLGISGGKDSSVAAGLMARALGTENVIGVLMPNGFQSDIGFAEGICRHLGILSVKADISPVTTVFHGILEDIMPGPGLSHDPAESAAPRPDDAALCVGAIH